MQKEKEMLKEWVLHYIKNRDILLRQIELIEEDKDGWDVIVHTKTGDKFYFILPHIDDIEQIHEKLDDNHITIVMLNKKENLDKIIEHWKKLVDFPKLALMFTNPNSELDKRWTIYPHTHDRITEKASLKKGLNSLYQTVEPYRS